MLENSRFYADEEKNAKSFAAELAENADVFVNDAFGTAHRAHASTEGRLYLVPCIIVSIISSYTFANISTDTSTQTSNASIPTLSNTPSNIPFQPSPTSSHCTKGVTAFLNPSVAGFLLQKELDYLQGAVDEPQRPFAAIVGGSKVHYTQHIPF